MKPLLTFIAAGILLGVGSMTTNAQIIQGAGLLQGIRDQGVRNVFFDARKPTLTQQSRASLDETGLAPRPRVYVGIDREVDLGLEQVEVNNEAIFLRNNQSIGDGRIEVFPIQRSQTQQR